MSDSGTEDAQRGQVRIGLLVNPVAGIGGTVGLKGSDGVALQQEARARGGSSPTATRTRQFLKSLADLPIRWIAPAGAMGGDFLSAWPDTELLSMPGAAPGDDKKAAEETANWETTAQDTRRVVADMATRVDCLVFVGGDGTARDVLEASPDVPCLGVPSGVKMHSGVFAVSPQAAAKIIQGLVNGDLTAVVEREVRDFDVVEADGSIRTRSFGELKVPEKGGYLQHTKQGGREQEPLALEEIKADLSEHLMEHRPLVFGPGGTVHAVQAAFGNAGTLRGFDVLLANDDWCLDADAETLMQVAKGARIVLSFTRVQGFLLGRGNQQLTAEYLAQLDWHTDVTIVATRTKIASLGGRPLLVDTGDEVLDQRLAGLHEIVAGYEDRLLHRIVAASRV